MDGSSNNYTHIWGVNGAIPVMGYGTTNRFIAVLLGDKGNALNCQMRYADSSGFTTSGGVGICQHSDGRIIDVVW